MNGIDYLSALIGPIALTVVQWIVTIAMLVVILVNRRAARDCIALRKELQERINDTMFIAVELQSLRAKTTELKLILSRQVAKHQGENPDAG